MTLNSLSLEVSGYCAPGQHKKQALKMSERDEDKGKQRAEMKTGRRMPVLDDL